MERETNSKQAVLRALEELPDDASLDEILDGLLLRLKVERGRAQIQAGKGIPHEDVKQRLAKWLA